MILLALVIGACAVVLFAAAGSNRDAAEPLAGAEPGAGVWADGSPAAGEGAADASSRSASYGGSFALKPTDSGHFAARVDDPAGGGRKVVQLTTDESLGDGHAVRMQLNGAQRLRDGQEVWILNEFYFGPDFPDLAADGWLSLSSVYGPPGSGSGPNTLSMRYENGANRFTWIEQPGGRSTLWAGQPATRGTWHVVVRHLRLDSDPDKGFMEIYYGIRGEPLQLQQLSGAASGQTRRYYASLQEGVNWNGSTPNSLNISNYHKDDMPGWEGQIPIYFANPRIFSGGASPESIARYSASH